MTLLIDSCLLFCVTKQCSPYLYYKIHFVALVSLWWGLCSEYVMLKMGLIFVQWSIIIVADYNCLFKRFETNKQTKANKDILTKHKCLENKFIFAILFWKYWTILREYTLEMKILTFYFYLYWNYFLNYFSSSSTFKIWMISQFYLNKVSKIKYERRLISLIFFFNLRNILFSDGKKFQVVEFPFIIFINF